MRMWAQMGMQSSSCLDPRFGESMLGELNQFKRNEIWNLFPKPDNKSIIGTKLNEDGKVVKDKKARFVA